jgi:hypothetical protein
MTLPKLTDDLARTILAGIRAGGFPHVVAAANGVDAVRWELWRRRSRGKHAREPYRGFMRAVAMAEAQARLRAEMEVREKDVRTWLKHGPGRDLPGKPGWAAVVRPAPPERRSADLLAAPEFLRFIATLRTVLAPYPEALTAVVQAIDGTEPAAPAAPAAP